MTENKNEKIYAVRSVSINNTKVVNRLKAAMDKLSEGEFNVYLGKGYKGQKLNIKLAIADKKLETGSLHDEFFLDHMDFLILDTLQLFLEPPLSEKYGKCFTARKLIKVMSGGECSETEQKQTAISQTKINDITERINYLSNIQIEIDKCTSIENRSGSDMEEDIEVIVSGRLLPVKCRPAGGKTEEFYFLPDSPMPLWKYASEKNQIIRVGADLFYCNGVVRNTDMNLVIKYFLIHEIMVMRYRNEKEENFTANKIYYSRSDGSGLLSVIGFKSEDKNAVLNKISVVHQTVCRVLDYYSEKGLITGYSPLKYSKNGAVKGVEIILPEKKSRKAE